MTHFKAELYLTCPSDWNAAKLNEWLARSLGMNHTHELIMIEQLAEVGTPARPPQDTQRFDKLERLAAQCGKQYWTVNRIGSLVRSSVKWGDLDWYDSPRAAIDAAPEKL